MKRGVLFVMALICTLMLVTPLFAQEARNYFKVGVITELSGDLATGGNITKRGYDL